MESDQDDSATQKEVCFHLTHLFASGASPLDYFSRVLAGDIEYPTTFDELSSCPQRRLGFAVTVWQLLDEISLPCEASQPSTSGISSSTHSERVATVPLLSRSDLRAIDVHVLVSSLCPDMQPLHMERVFAFVNVCLRDSPPSPGVAAQPAPSWTSLLLLRVLCLYFLWREFFEDVQVLFERANGQTMTKRDVLCIVESLSNSYVAHGLQAPTWRPFFVRAPKPRSVPAAVGTTLYPTPEAITNAVRHRGLAYEYTYHTFVADLFTSNDAFESVVSVHADTLVRALHIIS